MMKNLPLFNSDISVNYVLKVQPENRIDLGIQNCRFEPIFVIGCPRSGTTLFGNCLGNSVSNLSLDESLFLIDFWRIYSELYIGNGIDSISNLKQYTSENQLLFAIRDFSMQIFKGALINKKSTYIDHTPWYGLIVLFIKSLFPNAKFVHIIRNGLDVIESLRNSYLGGRCWAGANNLERLQIWNLFLENIKYQLNKIPQKDFILVKYEEFIEQPDLTLKDVCSKFGLLYSPEMVIPLAKTHASNSTNVYYDFDEISLSVSRNRIPLKQNKFSPDSSLSLDEFLSKYKKTFVDLNYQIKI